MNRIALPLAASFALAVAGCTSDDPVETPVTKTSLGSVAAGDLTVELLTDAQLETGMTPIYVKVTTTATGEPVSGASVTFVPLMTMMTSHSAPVVGSPMTLDANGESRCDVVFQMEGTWSATVGVTPSGAGTVDAEFASLLVTDSGRARTFTALDGSKYVLSLNLSSAPKVGLNPVVVTLHERSMDGMTFPPVNDAAIHLDPQMPSMMHGSQGTVDPTLASDGVYEGQLSFSMAGEWVTTATVSRDGTEITPAASRPTFTATF